MSYLARPRGSVVTYQNPLVAWEWTHPLIMIPVIGAVALVYLWLSRRAAQKQAQPQPGIQPLQTAGELDVFAVREARAARALAPPANRGRYS